MGRWLAIAALGAAFLAIPAWAQRHGGGFGGGGGHAGFGFHGGMGGMRGPAMWSRGFGGGPRGGFRGGPGFHGRPFGRGPGFFPGRPFRHHFYPRFYGNGYGYPGWGWYGGYGYYPSYYPYGDYSSDDYAQENQTYQQQQAEIDRLNEEVERLRQERSAQTPRPSPQAEESEESDATQLVFRDRHTEEIQNYAIVGQTLWVFTGDRTRKIMLADLDLPATRKVNLDRGINF